jgi:hypothetical protein
MAHSIYSQRLMIATKIANEKKAKAQTKRKKGKILLRKLNRQKTFQSL